jgi:hypothetical protein
MGVVNLPKKHKFVLELVSLTIAMTHLRQYLQMYKKLLDSDWQVSLRPRA